MTSEKNNSLSHLAHYDEQTSLPNRVFFNEVLNKSINHAKRHKKILSILLIDVDTKDNLSDAMLKEIGTRFASALRTEDILAKLEGGEFIVLLSDVGKPKFASTVAEKILSACRALPLTVSIGISIYPTDGLSLEELITNTHAALHKAKKPGSNAYQFYTQQMDSEAREYIKLDVALKSALEKNEITLHYQPQMHLRQGVITGVEALIRWEHPSIGVVSPAKLIALAEDTGLISQIGEWTIREACKANKHWQDEGYQHITVGVNVSPKQFYDPKLMSLLTNIFAETQLNPQYLELEVNEATVMDDIEIAAGILEQIKTLGVKISIDHFGIGYTSISHLKLFPITNLKIDQSFIKGLPNIPNDIAITNAFIALAHHLGFEVIAEGVETAEQVEYLSSQDCDIVQGYFLSEPQPAHKIELQFKKITDEVLI